MDRIERRISWLGIAALCLALAWGQSDRTVSAHAVPEETSPPADQAVPVMPSTVEIRFSEEVESEGTTLSVLKLDGTQVDMGNTALDLDDPLRRHVTVGVHPGLDNGVYLVQWTTVSALDGDTVSGSYQFTVDPSASPQPLPQIAAQQAPVQVPVVGETAQPNSSDRNPLLFGIAAAIAIFALIGLLFFWFFRRPNHGKRWKDDVVDRL